MANEPNVSVRVNLGNIAVNFLGSIVVAVLVLQRLDNAGRIALEGRSLAVTDLMPGVLPALATATAEEQVVVDFVVCGGLGTVEDGW